jgi:hypothetical protein
MPYDPKKDVLAEDLGEIPVDDTTGIHLGLCSYDGKGRKLALKRISHSRQGHPYTTSLGRFTRQELAALIPHLKRIALENAFWAWEPKKD